MQQVKIALETNRIFAAWYLDFSALEINDKFRISVVQVNLFGTVATNCIRIISLNELAIFKHIP